MKESGYLCYINVVVFPYARGANLAINRKGENRLYSHLFGRGLGYVAMDPR